MTTIRGAHPYTDVYPMLAEPEYERLRDSIEANGLRQPIITTPDGLVLDGRNRWKACVELGIDCASVVYDGEDIAEFVIDANTRRDMTDSQHAMVQAVIYARDGRREDGRWRRGSVDNPARGNSEKGWRNRLSEAGLILDHCDDDTVQSVISGALPLRQALAQAEAKRDAERNLLAEQERIEAEEADARARLSETAPDYLDRYPTARQAWAAWEDDNRREAARIRQEREAAKKKAAEEKRARSDLYTGIAKALGVLGGYGGYRDIGALMADYRPEELTPTTAARYLDPDNLAAARRFIDHLIEKGPHS